MGCAIMALRASRLLKVIVWLAGTSVLTSILLYMLGAHEAAVIELSVGAGLTTVLLVIAIAITGDELPPRSTLIPRQIAFTLTLTTILLVLLLVLPRTASEPGASDAPFAVVLWQQRAADTLLQIALIFVGLLAVLRLLAEGHGPDSEATREEDIAVKADAEIPHPSMDPELTA
jgi:uncharacterized MnhB-related membrane protein